MLGGLHSTKSVSTLHHSSGDYTLPTPIAPKGFLPLEILTMFMGMLSCGLRFHIFPKIQPLVEIMFGIVLPKISK